MALTLSAFVQRWLPSAGSERANKDSFIKELCCVLDLPEPDPAQGDPEKDLYVFECPVRMPQPSGKATTRFMDLYRAGCFVLEAKQSSEKGTPKHGTARRATEAWENAMAKAKTQAQRYADHLIPPPPFLIVCDIGGCFDLYASFDGTRRYDPFPVPEKKRLPFVDLPKYADLFRTIWTDPHRLDPSRQAREVSEEVAASLAELALALEETHPPQDVADFLMRCLFTMFAEDVGLLEQNLFTNAIEKYWIPSPRSFPAAIEGLWRAMNDGSPFGLGRAMLRFNGGLFENPSALPLTQKQLRMLLGAAKRDWSKVEPAIFGTLVEQALNPKERHRLGAHYTPRAYVERLVRPTVEEPLRAEWDVVRAEVWRYREQNRAEDAKRTLHAFHTRLTQIKVLDPACGTGNFLYVTLDILKQMESEIMIELRDLGERQELLGIARVSPAQLLGIEVNPRAKAIAELVLWLGHLQWHFRTHGRLQLPPEPVLQNLRNIECRDAVLAWDRIDLVRDARGKPVTRWDGETMKKNPVTGEPVPDDKARVPVELYINPRRAIWPRADYVVGNPPFVGTRRMRLTLGDGYVGALVNAIPEVAENADYVMYWWDRAAGLVADGKITRFGLITTNSITQTFNRTVLHRHLSAKKPISITFAVPDHPWVDSQSGAAVRVAMTSGAAGDMAGELRRVSSERSPDGNGAIDVVFSAPTLGKITEDLRVGASPAAALPCRANAGIAYWGVKFYGEGFIVTPEEALRLIRGHRGKPIIRPFVSGRDLTQAPRSRLVIDCDGLDLDELLKKHRAIYQHLLDHVKPVRDQNPRAFKRERWWIFGENQPGTRRAVAALSRYIATTETAKHRVFHFIDSEVLAEGTVTVIALDDAFFLGVLSSRAHVTWALAAGGRLGVGNDPRYNKTRCFDPFPFPACSAAVRQRVRRLAESLDAHRKCQQAAHPDLTITGMYNILSKLRAGEELTDKDRIIHQQGLVSVLKQIHDDLDAAVFEAYGWPSNLTDEEILEKLVALNAERADEERSGIVRWLRPELQNPTGEKKPTQTTLAIEGEQEEEQLAAAAATTTQWPRKANERIAAIRDLILASNRLWSAAEVTAAFKGAKKKDVVELLDSLDGLGIVTAYGETAKELRWGAP